MTALEELKVILGADISDYEKKLDRAGKVQADFGKKLQDVGESMTKKITLPLLLAGGAAVKFAADVVESENLYSVSMGKMADAGRLWTQELSRGLGLNEYEMRKNLGMLNQMLGSMGLGEKNAYSMAKGLTALAQDMASFFNLSESDAMQKLQSGITGEVEPLRRLGILVDENTVKMAAYKAGIAEVGSELTQVQKVQGRYLAIMQQTANAQGDLARTMDSPTNMMRALANQTKLLTIALGQELMPAFKLLLEVGGQAVRLGLSLVSAFSQLPGWAKGTAIAMLAVLAAIGPLFVVVGKLIVILPALKALFLAGATAMTPMIAGAALLAAKILLLGAVFAFFYANGKKIADGLSGVFLAFAGTALRALASVGEGLGKLITMLPGVGADFDEFWSSGIQGIKIWANAADLGAQSFADSMANSGGWIENTKAQLQSWADFALGKTAEVQAALGTPPVVPPVDFTITMSSWQQFTAYLKKTAADTAKAVVGSFATLGAGMVSSLAQGTFDGTKLMLDFAVRTLEMIVEWAIAGALAASGLSQALAVAFANPWIAAGVIAGLIAVVAGLSAAYKAKAGPAMATGGMTTGLTTGVTLGDNPSGQEVVLPLDSPRTTSALSKVMPEGGAGTQTIIFKLGEEEVARAAVQGMPSLINISGV